MTVVHYIQEIVCKQLNLLPGAASQVRAYAKGLASKLASLSHAVKRLQGEPTSPHEDDAPCIQS